MSIYFKFCESVTNGQKFEPVCHAKPDDIKIKLEEKKKFIKKNTLTNTHTGARKIA